jgi:hypothetical protein
LGGKFVCLPTFSHTKGPFYNYNLC